MAFPKRDSFENLLMDLRICFLHRQCALSQNRSKTNVLPNDVAWTVRIVLSFGEKPLVRIHEMVFCGS